MVLGSCWLLLRNEMNISEYKNGFPALFNPIWIDPVHQGTVLGKNACSLLSSDPEEQQKFVNS